MAGALRHRGPDDPGLVRSADAAIGCERLRITDRRPEASQPFTDPTGSVWLTLNGAIYNAAALRQRHGAFPYRSRSDVEPVLPAFLDEGASVIGDLDGMFALAVWDARARQLVLARDRAGEKPLFCLSWEDELWFASEVQALLCHPTFPFVEDREAAALFLALGYIPGTRTGFRDIRKVEPGTVMTVRSGGTEVQRYWSPGTVPRNRAGAREAAAQLRYLLEKGVRKQLAADVPVGVLTSGGVDSSLILAIAAHQQPRHRTMAFSVGFPEASYDERGEAAFASGYCGAPLVSVEADERSLSRALDAIIDRLAEPLADPAILPTYLLARTASRYVGVVLAGEGADELFGGYPTYIGHRLAAWVGRLPEVATERVRHLARAWPASHDKVPVEFLVKRFVQDVHRPLEHRHLAWFGTGLLSLLAEPDTVIEQTLHAARCTLHATRDTANDPVHATTLLDYATYLPDDLLMKVDRATMFCGLEARAPFLDQDVMQFALALDPALKVRGFSTKRLLKRVALDYLPPAVVRRRKRGLSVPVASWINGGLAAEVSQLVAPGRADAAGLLDGARVGQLAAEHRAGTANHARALWTLLVYHRWRRRWLGD